MKMNSKQTLTAVLGVVGVIGVSIAGWFAFETYKGNDNPGSSLISKLTAKQVSFDEAYGTLVDSYTQDYLEMTNKLKDFKAFQETINLNGNGNYDQFSGNINMYMSGIYSNEQKLVDNKGLIDLNLDGNVSFPSMAGGTGMENVSFSGGVGFQMFEGKMLGVLKSLTLSSSNPQISMVQGFVTPYLNKWMLLMDYNNLTGSTASPFSPNMSTNEIYGFINRVVDNLKKYPLVAQAGDAQTQGDYKVYSVDLNKQNVLELYKAITSDSFINNVTGVSQQEIQQGLEELSGAIANITGVGVMKVKDSENISLELSPITLDANAVMTGIFYKTSGKAGLNFSIVNPLQGGSNIVGSFVEDNGVKGIIEMSDNGNKIGTININLKSDLKNDGVNIVGDVSGNVFTANFNFKFGEDIKSISEIQSGSITMPQNVMDIKDLLNL